MFVGLTSVVIFPVWDFEEGENGLVCLRRELWKFVVDGLYIGERKDLGLGKREYKNKIDIKEQKKKEKEKKEGKRTFP